MRKIPHLADRACKLAQTPVGPLLRGTSLAILQTILHVLVPAVLVGMLYAGDVLGSLLRSRPCRYASARAGRFAEATADPFVLAVFRIALGGIGLWFALSTFHFVDFTWYSHGTEFRGFIRVVHGVWGALALLLVLGLGGRFTVCAHFIVICLILNGDDIEGTVNADLYLIASFWSMFTRLDGALTCKRFLPGILGRRMRGPEPNGDPPPKAWPLLLLGVNDGIFFLTAGLTKFYDPWWIQGLGFYQTFSLPWIKSPATTFLLNYEPLMVSLNWLALGHELCFLLLFLIPWTRWIACTSLGLFFLQLTYPIRIDFIGPFGMTHFFALAAVTPAVARKIRWLAARCRLTSADTPGIADQSPAECWRGAGASAAVAGREMLRHFVERPREFRALVRAARPMLLPARIFGNRVLAGFFVAYVALHSMFAILSVRFDPVYYYPPVANDPPRIPTGAAEASWLRQPISQLELWKRRLQGQLVWLTETRLYPPLRALNENATIIAPKSLFSAPHFFGVYAFRVVVTLRDGSTREPVVVFLEDKTGGPYSRGVGNPRYLQRCMYEVTLACQALLAHPGEPVNERWSFVMNNLLNFSVLQLSELEREQVVKAELLTSPIVVPNKYEGDWRPWLSYPWTAIYAYDAATDSHRYVDPPTPYPYRLVPIAEAPAADKRVASSN